ncbi:MAG: JEMB protein [Betaproteobacteria bacterium SG8_40]|jgi:heme-degrading monooxygenase HmoA|nr:MAG: JEMB protein [Betaproteobacteria bacterium SG8_40]
MNRPATTPEPPYYAVIFTSVRKSDDAGYGVTAQRMLELAARQPGFLGFETAHGDVGISVSYWSTLDAIKAWKANAEHVLAQQRGKAEWYASYRVRVCRVEREYGA